MTIKNPPEQIICQLLNHEKTDFFLQNRSPNLYTDISLLLYLTSSSPNFFLSLERILSITKIEQSKPLDMKSLPFLITKLVLELKFGQLFHIQYFTQFSSNEFYASFAIIPPKTSLEVVVRRSGILEYIFLTHTVYSFHLEPASRKAIDPIKISPFSPAFMLSGQNQSLSKTICFQPFLSPLRQILVSLFLLVSAITTVSCSLYFLNMIPFGEQSPYAMRVSFQVFLLNWKTLPKGLFSQNSIQNLSIGISVLVCVKQRMFVFLGCIQIALSEIRNLPWQLSTRVLTFLLLILNSHNPRLELVKYKSFQSFDRRSPSEVPSSMVQRTSEYFQFGSILTICAQVLMQQTIQFIVTSMSGHMVIQSFVNTLGLMDFMSLVQSILSEKSYESNTYGQMWESSQGNVAMQQRMEKMGRIKKIVIFEY